MQTSTNKKHSIKKAQVRNKEDALKQERKTRQCHVSIVYICKNKLRESLVEYEQSSTGVWLEWRRVFRLKLAKLHKN